MDGVTELCSKKKKDKRQSMIGKIIRKQTINNPSESSTYISREYLLRRPVSIINCCMREHNVASVSVENRCAIVEIK